MSASPMVLSHGAKRAKTEDVRFPQALQAGDDADFAQSEQGQQTGLHQRREPGHGEEDQKHQVGVFQHSGPLCVPGFVSARYAADRVQG
jgi:hypothetical protein